MKRLACYGWVGEDAGSVASANYLVLRELLRRGISVDLYANREHVPRPQGLNGDLRYVSIEPLAVARTAQYGGTRECVERAFAGWSIPERLLRVIGGPPAEERFAGIAESSSSRQTESLRGAA